jgi:hypothetical protein
MRWNQHLSTGACFLAVLMTATAYSQQDTTSAKKKAQAEKRRALEEQRKQLEQRRSDLAGQKASIESERRQIAQLKRDLRAANADVAQEQRNSRVWKCNLSGTEHNDPSECDDPSLGGVWITRPNPNLAGAQKRVQDLQKSLADAERQYDADLKAYNSENAKLNADGRKLAAEINAAGYSKRPVLLSSDPASVRDYTKLVADRAWSRNGVDAAENLRSDTELSKALTTAAKGSKFLKDSDLKAYVAIESQADRDTGVNADGYAGLFQMGKAAAKDVKYDYTKLSDPANWQMNVEAGVKYLEKNAGRLEKKGVPVTPLNLYIAHNQGASGAANIIRRVQDGSAQTTPANDNMLNNLPDWYINSISRLGRQVTVQNYYDYFSDAYNAVNSKVNAPPK